MHRRGDGSQRRRECARACAGTGSTLRSPSASATHLRGLVHACGLWGLLRDRPGPSLLLQIDEHHTSLSGTKHRVCPKNRHRASLAIRRVRIASLATDSHVTRPLRVITDFSPGPRSPRCVSPCVSRHNALQTRLSLNNPIIAGRSNCGASLSDGRMRPLE